MEIAGLIRGDTCTSLTLTHLAFLLNNKNPPTAFVV